MRNIGIFAHVDAGKTTLSEQLLLKAGAIRSAGSVDSGTAHTDTLDVERRRGISVRASCVRLRWKGEDVNLIDTPGHADFSAEIERSLWALDGAGAGLGVPGLPHPTRLAQATAGRGGMSTRLHGYRECPPGLGATAPRRGVDPLDTSRYILAARSALEGGIFDP